MTFNKTKFSAMLHYIIGRCGNLPNVGKTVIWKMLYFSEFNFYELFEKHIAGETFAKLERGPAPRHFDTIIKKLEKSKQVKSETAIYCGHSQFKYISLQPADISCFSALEIKEIDKVIDKLSTMTATQISAHSHEDMPWKSAKNNENLDYEMVFYRNEVMSVREYKE